jgi:hypothetical protein
MILIYLLKLIILSLSTLLINIIHSFYSIQQHHIVQESMSEFLVNNRKDSIRHILLIQVVYNNASLLDYND